MRTGKYLLKTFYASLVKSVGIMVEVKKKKIKENKLILD